MFAPAMTSEASVVAVTPPTTSNPARPSRLRGLSYFRSYTTNLSLHHQQQTSGASTPDRTRRTRSTSTSTSSPARSPQDQRPTTPGPTSAGTGGNGPPPPVLPTPAPSSTPGIQEVGADARLGGMARIRRTFSSQNATSTTDGVGSSNTSANNEGSSLARGMQTSGVDTEPSSLQRTQPSTLAGLPADQMPTIKFIPHQDPRAGRPSLAFVATSRTLPHEDCVIRVGRYSERDVAVNPPAGLPSSAPVGFKSKVVSRKHCEFWCSQGQWYIRDVKSSSGTFLNHIRLSQPSQESRPFPINDGDVVQLGIDFRGGEEAIFRCVKIRIECNRSWQKSLNSFNVTTHKRLRDLSKAAQKDSDKASPQSTECAICLMSIAPCQSLFVAPCSHVWHFKCIRPMLNDHKSYPQFMCPNCRGVTDLEADVEDPVNDWEEDFNSDEEDSSNGKTGPDIVESSQPATAASDPASVDAGLAHAAQQQLDIGTGIDSPLDSITQRPAGIQPTYLGPGSVRPGTPGTGLDTPANEGPLTPRNDAGPFVFDGSAGRAGGQRLLGVLKGSRE